MRKRKVDKRKSKIREDEDGAAQSMKNTTLNIAWHGDSKKERTETEGLSVKGIRVGQIGSGQVTNGAGKPRGHKTYGKTHGTVLQSKTGNTT